MQPLQTCIKLQMLNPFATMGQHISTPAGVAVVDIRVHVAAGLRRLWWELRARLDLMTGTALLVRRIPEVLGVCPSMISRREQLQILWSIVRAVAVFVVNLLRSFQWSTQHAFHYDTVLSLASPIDVEVAVPPIDVARAVLRAQQIKVPVFLLPFVVLVAEVLGDDGFNTTGDGAAWHAGESSTSSLMVHN